MKHTHTYAILRISYPAYKGIRKKLLDAGYQDQFHTDDGQETIDMYGIAIQRVELIELPTPPQSRLIQEGKQLK